MELSLSEIINQASISQRNLEDSYRKVLGHLWNIQTDVLRLRSIDNTYSNTKRGLRRLLCSLFNPLGIVVLVLLEPKLIVQVLRR